MWLTLLIVLLVGGGFYWIYTHPVASAAPEAAQPAALPAEAQATLQALQQRLAALEQRPAASGAPQVNLAPLESRLATLETAVRSAAAHPGTPADTAALASRITALEQRQPGPAADPSAPIAAAIAPLVARLDADEASLKATATQDGAASAAVAKLGARLDAVEAKLQQVVAQEAARAAAAARLRAAEAALAAGQKLGALPGAPPALARFADAPPPTEAALRLEFTAAAAAAEAASQPSTAGLGTFGRMWQRVSALVTIRNGDKVIVGPPAAFTLNQARLRLDVGDLAGALAALTPLDAKAAAALAPWRAQVQALLDARAALAAMEARP
jgi:hypothetical protein